VYLGQRPIQARAMQALLRPIFCFLALWSSIFASYGQNTAASQRQRLYESSVEDKIWPRAAALALEIGEAHERAQNPQAAIMMYQKAEEHAKKINNNRLIGRATEKQGDAYLGDGETVMALSSYQKALTVYQGGGLSGDLMRVYQKIGRYYARQKDYNRAIDIYEQARDLAESKGSQKDILDCYAQLAALHKAKGDREEAEVFTEMYEQEAKPEKIEVVTEKTKLEIAKTEEAIKNLGDADAVRRDSLKQVLDGLQASKVSLESMLAATVDSLNRSEQQNRAQQGLIDAANERLRLFGIIGLVVAALLAVSILATVRISRQKAALKRSNDEISKQNRLIAAQKEDLQKQKQKTEQLLVRKDELLLNILPKEVAEELENKNNRRYTRKHGAVSVLFSDFEGFTRISSTMSPDALIDELHECFSAFDEICGRYGLEKIKTIGDAYMCAGGVPIDSLTHATDAVSAALEMLAFMERRKRHGDYKGGQPLEVRIGIHSGPVVAGVVGTKKFAYDIWGDTVNTAARMEQSGESGRVNISEATYELVKGDFYCRYRGQIEAKNKGLIDMYFVEEKL
jgi:adenylate cyclase